MQNNIHVAGLLALIFFLPVTSAMSQTSSGVISFRGAIVNESCATDTLKHSVIFRCEEKISQSGWPLAADQLSPGALPAMVSEMRTHWIDEKHHLGVLTMTYR